MSNSYTCSEHIVKALSWTMPSYCIFTFCILFLLLSGCGRNENFTQSPPEAATTTPATNYVYPGPIEAATTVSERAPSAYPGPIETETILPELPPEVLLPPNVLGIIVSDELTVQHVEPNSAASIAGIMIGDTLLTIGEVSFKEQTDKVKALVFGSSDGQEFTITLLRNNKVLTLKIIPTPMQPQKPQPTFVVPPDDYF